MANPKPQLEKETGAQGVWSFLDKHWQIVAVILAVVAIFVWYQALNLGSTVQKTLNNTATSTDNQGTTPSPTPSSPTPQSPQPTPPPAQPSAKAAQYTQTAQRGQGVTHLARQALQSYLTTEKPKITLTREHKIYIEDYLKDQKVGQVKSLHAGQQLSFSTTDITQGIERSQQLTSHQLNNLTQYANRVSGLTAYSGI